MSLAVAKHRWNQRRELAAGASCDMSRVGMRRRIESALGPLGRALSRDRVLLFGFLVLSVVVLFPLTCAHYLPLTDLPHHAALARMGSEILAGDELANHFFTLQPRPSPYWSTYLLLMTAGAIMGPLYATHLVVALVLLAVPLGFMRLCIALGRSPRLGLLSFFLAWDFNVTMGFLAFSLGTGLSFWFVARVLEGLRGGRWASKSELVKTAVLAGVVPWTHAQAGGAASVLLGALLLVELGRRRFASARWLGVWAAAPMLALVPWLVSRPADGRGPMPPLEQLAFWPPAGARLDHLVYHTLGYVSGNVPSQMQGMLVLFFLLFPLFVLGRGAGPRRTAGRAYALYGASLALVLSMPSSFFWPFHQVFVYERHLTMFLLFGLLLTAEQFRGRRLAWLAPGVIIGLASSVILVRYFDAFNRETAPLQEIVDAIPERKKVLPIVWTVRPPESVFETTFALTAYYTAQKAGYTPHLFVTPNLPIRPREEKRLPAPVWKQPALTTVKDHAVFYDYVLVQGIARDRLRKKAQRAVTGETVRLEHLRDAGDFRLYQVVRHSDE